MAHRTGRRWRSSAPRLAPTRSTRPERVVYWSKSVEFQRNCFVTLLSCPDNFVKSVTCEPRTLRFLLTAYTPIPRMRSPLDAQVCSSEWHVRGRNSDANHSSRLRSDAHGRTGCHGLPGRSGTDRPRRPRGTTGSTGSCRTRRPHWTRRRPTALRALPVTPRPPPLPASPSTRPSTPSAPSAPSPSPDGASSPASPSSSSSTPTSTAPAPSVASMHPRTERSNQRNADGSGWTASAPPPAPTPSEPKAAWAPLATAPITFVAPAPAE